MEKLKNVKPCPLCGKQPYGVQIDENEPDYQIECEDNQHYIEVQARTKRKAIKAWNTRY